MLNTVDPIGQGEQSFTAVAIARTAIARGIGSRIVGQRLAASIVCMSVTLGGRTFVLEQQPGS